MAELLLTATVFITTLWGACNLKFFIMKQVLKFEPYSYVNAQGETVNCKIAKVDTELVSISSKPIDRKNSDKQYRIANVRFTVATKGGGEKTAVTDALVNEANYQYGMEKGLTYQAKFIRTEGNANPLLVVSHFVRGERLDDTFFDDLEEFVEEPVNLDTASTKGTTK